MSKRLWEKGADLDAGIHRFTVGDDPQWDHRLAHWDCLGTAAHARTLIRAGILTNDESDKLIAELARIDADANAGRFEIPDELEDCHTAIEACLTQALGELGEKIHAGRSRNDQVATAMRLYMRNETLEWIDRMCDFVTVLLSRIERDGGTPMPGYTHMQPAMPSSFGMWLHAFVEAAFEQIRAAHDLLNRLDFCPLGTGAGFGVPLPLDREFTAKLLGFTRLQRSPIDVQNSRGRMETYFVRVAVDIGAMLEKMSWDLILFSSQAYRFFTLPESMTTGSSLMPQKRNPDVLELLRARGGWLRGLLQQIEWTAGKLPSSYHRDLQLTKGPAIAAAEEIARMLRIATSVVEQIEVNADAMRTAMTPELYATDAAMEMVRSGAPFRSAYREIASQVRSGKFDASKFVTNSSIRTGTLTKETIIELMGELRSSLAAAVDLRRQFEQCNELLHPSGKSRSARTTPQT